MHGEERAEIRLLIQVCAVGASVLHAIQHFHDERAAPDPALVESVRPETQAVDIGRPAQDVLVDIRDELDVARIRRVGRKCLGLICELVGDGFERHALGIGGGPEGQADRIGRAVEIGDVHLDEAFERLFAQSRLAAELAQVHRSAEHRKVGPEIDQFHIVELDRAQTAIGPVRHGHAVRAEGDGIIGLVSGEEDGVDPFEPVDPVERRRGRQRGIVCRRAFQKAANTCAGALLTAVVGGAFTGREGNLRLGIGIHDFSVSVEIDEGVAQADRRAPVIGADRVAVAGCARDVLAVAHPLEPAGVAVEPLAVEDRVGASLNRGALDREAVDDELADGRVVDAVIVRQRIGWAVVGRRRRRRGWRRCILDRWRWRGRAAAGHGRFGLAGHDLEAAAIVVIAVEHADLRAAVRVGHDVGLAVGALDQFSVAQPVELRRAVIDAVGIDDGVRTRDKRFTDQRISQDPHRAFRCAVVRRRVGLERGDGRRGVGSAPVLPRQNRFRLARNRFLRAAVIHVAVGEADLRAEIRVGQDIFLTGRTGNGVAVAQPLEPYGRIVDAVRVLDRVRAGDERVADIGVSEENQRTDGLGIAHVTAS